MAASGPRGPNQPRGFIDSQPLTRKVTTVLGFVRLMRDRLTPYRGWAAWHHLAGVAGGLVVVTRKVTTTRPPATPARWCQAAQPR
jgi:hypothetical protein